VFSVGKAASSKQPIAEVTIQGMPCRLIIDTGCSSNIIDFQTYQKFEVPPKLKPAKANLFAYGASHPMEVAGVFESEIKTQHNITHATFYVTKDSHGSLMSYKTASELGLIAVHINSVKSDSIITIDDIKKLHPELFRGIGKLKNQQIKLHIDESVKPVAQSHRRVPFHFRKAVEQEIKILLDQQIIERADGHPTKWLSPIVIARRPNDPDRVRLCIDMRVANTAILREKHVMPTFEEILSDLNGSTVFRKLDLNLAYNQLELHPDSRHISTFSTHLGLFRYKRLFFGCSSAS